MSKGTLTDEPVGTHAASGDDDKSKAEDSVECEPLSPWNIVVPRDDARQRNCVEIAEYSANTSSSVDGIAIREAFEVGGERIFEVESHPVCLCRSAVDQEHDAECNGVQDGKDNRKPDTPVPFLRVRASD